MATWWDHITTPRERGPPVDAQPAAKPPPPPRSPRGAVSAGTLLETLGAALQLPSTPRWQRAVSSVDHLGSVAGKEPSAPHRPPGIEDEEHRAGASDDLVATLLASPGDNAAARRAQAAGESALVARALDDIRAGAGELDLWGGGLSDLQVSVLLDALCGSRADLRVLDLGRNTIGEEAMCSLERFLETRRELEQLRLCGNSLGDAAVARLARALLCARQGGRGSRLTMLSLDANLITDKGAAELTSAIAAGALQSLTALHLANNKLTGASVLGLLKALSASWPPGRGSAGEGPRGLCELNVRRNGLGDPCACGVAALLQQRRCEVQALDMADNMIGNAGATALGEALRSAKTLTSLSLQGNPDIDEEGVRALARGLVTNLSFQTIRLSGTEAPLDVQYFRTSKQVMLRALPLADKHFVEELLRFNLNLTFVDKDTLVIDDADDVTSLSPVAAVVGLGQLGLGQFATATPAKRKPGDGHAPYSGWQARSAAAATAAGAAGSDGGALSLGLGRLFESQRMQTGFADLSMAEQTDAVSEAADESDLDDASVSEGFSIRGRALGLARSGSSGSVAASGVIVPPALAAKGAEGALQDSPRCLRWPLPGVDRVTGTRFGGNKGLVDELGHAPLASHAQQHWLAGAPPLHAHTHMAQTDTIHGHTPRQQRAGAPRGAGLYSQSTMRGSEQAPFSVTSFFVMPKSPRMVPAVDRARRSGAEGGEDACAFAEEWRGGGGSRAAACDAAASVAVVHVLDDEAGGDSEGKAGLLSVLGYDADGDTDREKGTEAASISWQHEHISVPALPSWGGMRWSAGAGLRHTNAMRRTEALADDRATAVERVEREQEGSRLPLVSDSHGGGSRWELQSAAGGETPSAGSPVPESLLSGQAWTRAAASVPPSRMDGDVGTRDVSEALSPSVRAQMSTSVDGLSITFDVSEMATDTETVASRAGATESELGRSNFVLPVKHGSLPAPRPRKAVSARVSHVHAWLSDSARTPPDSPKDLRRGGAAELWTGHVAADEAVAGVSEDALCKPSFFRHGGSARASPAVTSLGLRSAAQGGGLAERRSGSEDGAAECKGNGRSDVGWEEVCERARLAVKSRRDSMHMAQQPLAGRRGGVAEESNITPSLLPL